MESIVDMVECPICMETMISQIRQCKKGHSVCNGCANRISNCPLCKSPMTTARNFQLEKLIANLKEIDINHTAACKYEKRGCKVHLNNPIDLKDHELECKKRNYQCEGKLYVKWNCDWTGYHENIFEHFKNQHVKNSWMEYQTSVFLKLDFNREYSDVQIIPYKNGKELFWYKHKIDPWREKAYWAFQYIGPKSEAHKYFYEFTVSHNTVRILLNRDVCESDSFDPNELFEKGKCVTISFSTLKNYLNEDHEIHFTFTIGEVTDRGTPVYPNNHQQSLNNSTNNQPDKSVHNNVEDRYVPSAVINPFQGQQIRYVPPNVHNVNMGPLYSTHNFHPTFFNNPGIPFTFQVGLNGSQGFNPPFMPPFVYRQNPQFPHMFPPHPPDYFRR